MKFYINENNSSGYTVALGVLGEEKPHWAEIEAESVDEAIKKFENHFNLDWNYENSYEGNSCNCCGRRFSLYAPKGHEESDYDEYNVISTYEGNDIPYFAKNKENYKPSQIGIKI